MDRRQRQEDRRAGKSHGGPASASPQERAGTNPDEQKRVSRRLAGKMAVVEGKLKAASDERFRYHIAKQFIDKYFPTDTFQTLFTVMLIVVLATVLRGFFEFWQESLVGAVVNRSQFDLR